MHSSGFDFGKVGVTLYAGSSLEIAGRERQQPENKRLTKNRKARERERVSRLIHSFQTTVLVPTLAAGMCCSPSRCSPFLRPGALPYCYAPRLPCFQSPSAAVGTWVRTDVSHFLDLCISLRARKIGKVWLLEPGSLNRESKWTLWV